ncbi:MAG: helix-turn-helix domain-containing protein [Syntrophorhabdales bacterium]
MVDENLLTLKQVSERLGVSKVTLWRWIKDGKLSSVRLSQRTVYIRKEEVDRFLKASETTA